MTDSASRVDLELAARLRATRREAGLTQVAASAFSGISLGTVHKAETFGAASTRTLAALAKLYKLTLDDLRTRRSA